MIEPLITGEPTVVTVLLSTLTDLKPKFTFSWSDTVQASSM